MSTYNIFEAARKLKIKNIISASSETVLGLPMVDKINRWCALQGLYSMYDLALQDPLLPVTLPVTEESQPPRPEVCPGIGSLGPYRTVAH
jgi:nucleoside-diphosphate-sugar epimerase